MRSFAPVAVLMALASLLSGCSSEEAAPPAVVAEPRWVTLDPVVLADDTFQWHKTGSASGPAAVLEYFDLVSQAVAHPCVWEGGNGEEVYFNNLQLPTGRESQALGEWSGNLSITLDWTDTDWIGSALRAAYQAPGLNGWHETKPIGKGTTLTVAIRVPAPPANATEEAEEEDASSDWSVWLCLPTNTGEPEQPFIGSVQAKVVFAPDPVLESALAEETAPEGNRTARGGLVPTQPAL